jgi:hypothetical protein
VRLLKQELEDQSHRAGLLALKAAQGGIVGELTPYTLGTVVGPGTVNMTLAP